MSGVVYFGNSVVCWMRVRNHGACHTQRDRPHIVLHRTGYLAGSNWTATVPRTPFLLCGQDVRLHCEWIMGETRALLGDDERRCCKDRALNDTKLLSLGKVPKCYPWVKFLCGLLPKRNATILCLNSESNWTGVYNEQNCESQWTVNSVHHLIES